MGDRGLSDYSEARGLSIEEEDAFARSAPFLESFKEVQAVAGGTLPGGIDGVVAHIAIRRKTGSSARSFKDVPYTIVQTAVPESLGFMPTLLLRNREQRFVNIGTFRGMGQSPDRQVKLESSILKERYWIFVLDDQEEGWVRELFSPTFVDWLEREAPEDFGFDLEQGSLTSITTGHVDDLDRLDALCKATATVAARLREESLEDHAVGSTAGIRAGAEAELARSVDQVNFEQAPPSTSAAAEEFEGVARKERGSWQPAIIVGVLALGLGLAFTRSLFLAAIAGVVAGVATYRGLVRGRARRYGEQAFLEHYAGARNLRLERPRDFHARNIGVTIPGVAYGVLHGRLPGTSLEGSLVLATESSDRECPVDYNVLVVDEPATASARVKRAAIDSFGLGAGDGKVWAYRRGPARDQRTVEELDRFCAEAAAFLGEPTAS